MIERSEHFEGIFLTQEAILELLHSPPASSFDRRPFTKDIQRSTFRGHGYHLHNLEIYGRQLSSSPVCVHCTLARFRPMENSQSRLLSNTLRPAYFPLTGLFLESGTFMGNIKIEIVLFSVH